MRIVLSQEHINKLCMTGLYRHEPDVKYRGSIYENQLFHCCNWVFEVKYNELINDSNKKDVEIKTIDMNGFNSLFDNLEEYFNSKGYTLGTDADGLQELMHCIQYCNIYGVTTDEQLSDMKTKFRKFVSASLSEIKTVDNK